MKKQIDGQLNLFDYISDQIESDSKAEQNNEIVQSSKTEIKKINKGKKSSINFFGECEECWCKDCRHNEKLDGEPRDFAGEQSPCPSCEFCIKAGKAEICEIDSYKNGCKLRALEEGIEP